MHIVPPDRIDVSAATRGGARVIAGVIKQAAGGFIHPGDLMTSCRVLPPARVGERKPGGPITRGQASRSNARVAELVALGHAVGQQTFFRMTGARMAADLLLRQVEATSVTTAATKLPDMKEMAAAANAIVGRHRQAREGAGWKPVAQESVLSVQALKQAMVYDLHASGLLAGSSFAKTGLAAKLDQSHRWFELARGNMSLLSAACAEVVEMHVPKAVATSLIHVLTTRYRLSVG